MSESNDGLIESIRLVTGFINPKMLTLASDEKRKTLTLLGVTNEGSCFLRTAIPAPEGLKDTQFTVEVAALMSAIKGKSDITLAVQDSKMTLSTKGYKAVVASSESVVPTHLFEPDENSVAIPTEGEAWQWLYGVIKSLNLTHIESTPSMLYARITAKGAFAIAYNTYQMKFISTKEVTSKESIELSVPLQTAKRIITSPFLGKQILVSPSSILFSMPSAKAKLPTFEPDFKIEPATLLEMAGKSRNLKGITLTLPKEEVRNFLDNSSYVASAQSTVTLTAASGKVKLTCSASSGSTHAVFPSKVSEAVSFQMRVAALLDALSGKDDTIEVTVADNSTIVPDGKFSYRAAIEMQ